MCVEGVQRGQVTARARRTHRGRHPIHVVLDERRHGVLVAADVPSTRVTARAGVTATGVTAAGIAAAAAPLTTRALLRAA